jgi:hypothetical protein
MEKFAWSLAQAKPRSWICRGHLSNDGPDPSEHVHSFWRLPTKAQSLRRILGEES